MGIIAGKVVIGDQDQEEELTPPEPKPIVSMAELRSSIQPEPVIEEVVPEIESTPNAGAKKSQYMLDMFNSEELISFDEEE